jgi:hypothetical protein
LVGIYHADQAGLDNDPATPWFTTCEVHHNCVGHPSLRLAKSHAVNPSGWCQGCTERLKNPGEAVEILDDIPIPYSPEHSANQDRYGIGDGSKHQECLLCARPIKVATLHVILLTDDLGMITDPSRNQETTGGCFYVGPDCWKRHLELHPYEVKP